MTSPLGTGIVTPFNPKTGNSLLDPLIVWGFKWGNGGVGVGTNVTYSFPTYNAVWHNDYAQYLDNEPFNGFAPFSPAQQTAAVAALATWAEVANITFQELDDVPGDNDVGDIRFGNSNSVTQSTAVAWAYFPNDGGGGFQYPEAGDVWFDASYQPNQQLNPGEFGFSTMVHEIGHSLGLDHPFADVSGEVALPPALDNQRYTIMSYDSYSGATIEAYGPMLLDILAIQYLYGANMTTRAGDTTYVFNAATEELKCIWDAGGYDTFDLGNQTVNAVIDLRAGQFSSIGIKNNGKAATGNIGIAYNVVIEEAIGGSGNDKITGNDANNKLTGGGGNDTIEGGAGADIIDGGIGNDAMTGGLGDDLYRVDSVNDSVGEAQTNANGGGIDTVESQVSYSIAGFANIDNLTLLGGSAANATGNASGNTLRGNALVNMLDGGTGADTLQGGAGNDIYFIDNAGDVVDEQGNADSEDEIRATYLLAAGVTGIEHYTYLGTGNWTFTGTSGHNRIMGSSGNDTIDGGVGLDGLLGGGGNDTLIGGLNDDYLDGGAGNDKLIGGAGNDTMIGGLGSDTYTVEDAGDQVIETTAGAAGGTDLVQSTITFSLAALANVENLTLLGATDIDATGNSGVNVVTGNDGKNRLDGGGGADTLVGGKGDDTYVVQNAGIVVSETLTNADGGGIDTVETSFNYSIAALANVDNLTLMGSALSATGNAAANILRGNALANTLDGGAGGDTLQGGAGNDIYFIDNAGDVVDEQGNADSEDEIRTTYLLAAGVTGIEHYTYLGAGNWTFTGTSGHNRIIGGSGNDTIDGGVGLDGLLGGGGSDTLIGGLNDDYLDGGVGADALKGGAGNDTYLIDNAGDTIDEEGNADSNDIVLATVTVDLSVLGAGAVEHATLSGAGALNATGNASANKLTGGDGANVLDGLGGADIMTGGLGSDTYKVDNVGDQVVEATAGATGGTDLVQSTITFSIGALANVENLTLLGTADIDATGNSGVNVVTGNDGKNRLDGGGGADTLVGGKGDDTYVVQNAGIVVSEVLTNANSGGVDTVEANFNYSIAALANVDNLTLVGAAISATGNAAANVLRGNALANTLDGAAGADTLEGGAGNDIYFIDNAGDVVDEQGNADSEDEIRTSYLLTTGVTGIEHYTYLGTGNWTFTGTSGHNRIIGGSGNDTIDGAVGHDGLLGGAGNDTLIGGIGNDYLDGGTGVDKLFGGSGNDTYLIDNLADSIDEEGNADSNDIVLSTVTVNLSVLGGGAVEHATLSGAAALNATGNASANTLTGGDGANALDGLGGADTMSGGLGSDTYTVDDAGDQVIEATAGAPGGTDLVRSYITFSLAALANVENLTLLGATNIDATGNGGVNILTGNDGNNRLDGGAGADTLVGGKGDDTYVVEIAGDVVSETLTNANNGGIDTVEASLNYSIAALTNIDNLTLVGAALSATGNAAANILRGNALANTLDGGAGADMLQGGAGNDIYFIDNAGDVVDEQGNADSEDEIRTGYLLSAGVTGIEHYTYLGTGNWTFTGTSGHNRITGSSGNDTIDGGVGLDGLLGGGGNDTLIGGLNDDYLDGGTGNDKLLGGSGNDTYLVDAAGDTIDEQGNADTGDTVRSTVTVNLNTLGGGAVEHATLLGASAINATGNGSNNALTGNTGANILDGGGGDDTLVGGLGADKLTGGSGRDTFDYNNLSEAGDTITDFVKGAAGDILQLADLLDNIGYAGANPFADAVLNFAVSGANTLVRVDSDGAGAGAAVTLVTLTNVILTQGDTDNYLV